MRALPKIGDIVKVCLWIPRTQCAEWPWAIVRAVHKKTWDGEINNYLVDGHRHFYAFGDLVRFREVQQTIDGERHARWQALRLVKECTEEQAAEDRAARERRHLYYAELVSKMHREAGTLN